MTANDRGNRMGPRMGPCGMPQERLRVGTTLMLLFYYCIAKRIDSSSSDSLGEGT